MKFRNYTIEKENERNWAVNRYDNAVALKDIKKDGAVTVKKGETYIKETLVGYYGDVASSFNGVIKDCAGVGCGTLSDVVKQVAGLKEEINQLLK